MTDLDQLTRSLLEGCRVTAQDGTVLYTPDGRGNYRALWGRDFAYMLHGAGDLIPLAHQKACIEFLMRGAREDGWIPDRVEPDGKPLYTAGDEHFPALANLDTGAYLVLAAEEYLARLPEAEAAAQFLAWAGRLRKCLACLPVGRDGLILNDTTPPHSPYGFTDCVAKTGSLAFESLLHWTALRTLSRRLRAAGLPADREEAGTKAIEASFAQVFTDPESGLFYSATGVCRQLDLWASCYAVYLDFPLPEGQRERISRWMGSHYGEVTEAGQLRHLPAGEHWESLFVPVNGGEYQNGAFWATPVEWLCACLAVTSPALARQSLRDLLCYFDRYGSYECVNGPLRRLDTFVVSATNARAASRLPCMDP